MAENQYEHFLEERALRVATLREQISGIIANFPKSDAGDVFLTLEIGCGHGHFLSAYAKEFTNELCIGLDLISKRIACANRKKMLGKIQNVFFFKAEAEELLEALPDCIILKKIFILFPDPWPKKRHFKNRLTRGEILDTLAKRASKDSLLHFRSDHKDFFDWSAEQFTENTNWEILPDAIWPFEKESYFQAMMGEYNSLIAKKV